ncbi:PREDICTED: pentatricopeptide repeat-containing protein At2g42920, chloroplastic-like [Populus euphratica]|uniref:Pentatricopeptide repeat-containing protein At2g42920, chloroplastic-like n=1 Tax=Populus euphratica TaxID=75702 RepID=A0AAJ6XPB6_POPEU|nr:PREDICTED: pentatricopeptide repeat-containing protein At2g42920, chloroplastic-like [Populus euphratica]
MSGKEGSFEATDLFRRMKGERTKPSEFTMVSLLNACACLGALRQGEWIHDYIVKDNFALNAIVVTAIIDGAPSLAMNGRENEAVQLFSMLESSNGKPDHISFLGVLTACNRGGMVDRETDYFLLMTETIKIELSIEHYSCMVDVLDRAGLLEETEELIRSIPVNPGAVILGGLYSPLQEVRKIEMAKRAVKHVTD